MKRLIPLFSAIFVFPLTQALQAEPQVLAQDDASQAAYQGGWSNQGGGNGFSDWSFKTQKTPKTDSFAGHFIATRDNNPDCDAILTENKAFGMFANGRGFEAEVAFRRFTTPLNVGDSFSFAMDHSQIAQKFDSDDGPNGAIGLTLRSGNATNSIDDYNAGARFEFGFYEGQTNYLIFDGEENHDTGIAWTDAGFIVTVKLTGPDTYDFAFKNLADNKVTELKGRKLGGTAGTSIESFSLFDRDGEKADLFFNSFKVSRE